MNREQIEELAIQFSTEGLSSEENVQYQAWLEQADDEQKAIFANMVDLSSDISVSVSPELEGGISPLVKAGLMDTIKNAPPKSNSNEKAVDPDILHIPSDQREWINLPVKGAQLLELSARKSDGFAVSIIHLEAGGVFPEHDHHGVEMAYILEGDLEADGVIFNAGDFFRADAGSHHGTHHSPSGCQALIMTANENYKHKSVKTLGAVQKIYRRCKKLLTH